MIIHQWVSEIIAFVGSFCFASYFFFWSSIKLLIFDNNLFGWKQNDHKHRVSSIYVQLWIQADMFARHLKWPWSMKSNYPITATSKYASNDVIT